MWWVPAICVRSESLCCKGRDFTERDTEATPLAALINQSLARKYWPDQDPIGARISSDGNTWATIQGVVGDVRQGGLSDEPVPEVYLSVLAGPVCVAVSDHAGAHVVGSGEAGGEHSKRGVVG